MSLDLVALFSGQIFAFMMVFTRISAGLMFFPGLGEAFVSLRVRMMFALIFSFALTPVLAPFLPAMPSEVPLLVKMMAFEVLVGAFFGAVMRLMMGIVETAGSIIAMEIGLSNAMVLNPALATQSALTSAFLSLAALIILFVSGFDHLLFRALVNTYDIFPVGKALPFGEILELVVSLIARAFKVGVQLAAPFMIVGLLIYSSVGIMQRLMPQIQLFLVMLPVQIMGGIFVFGVCITTMLTVWLTTFDDVVGMVFIR